MVENKIIKEILLRLDKLEGAVFGKKDAMENQNIAKNMTAQKSKLDFEINERAFFKIHAKSMSGPKRFTLVVAFLSKGLIDKQISSEQIVECWNQNFTFLGGKKLTSRTYGTRAKENIWVGSKKHGFYELTDKWEKIFTK